MQCKIFSYRWFRLGVLLILSCVIAAIGITRFGGFDDDVLSRPPSATVGHLGGYPVSVPHTYSYFLEYDDPETADKSIKEKKPRTYASPIRGFLFLVHYPDMTPMAPFNKKRFLESRDGTMLRVLVDSNSYYGGDGVPSALFETAGQRLSWKMVRSSKYVYDLEEFRPAREGINAPPEPIGTDFRDQDVYIHRDNKGVVDTIIQCHNTTHPQTPCKMTFVMPHIRTKLVVSFRRDFLSQWQSIKESVIKAILSFGVTNTPLINNLIPKN
jgi:hypothetical protein